MNVVHRKYNMILVATNPCIHGQFQFKIAKYNNEVYCIVGKITYLRFALLLPIFNDFLKFLQKLAEG